MANWLQRLAHCLVASVVLAGLGLAPALAQNFPNKPVKLIIPFAPGGHLDVSGRVFAEKLSQRFGQPVVVENRPGASGTIGAGAVARAPADGYTILLAPNSLAIADSLLKNVTYKLATDLMPVSMLTRYPYVIVGSKNFPPNTFAELIEHGRKNPGTNFATTGVGTANHLVMEIINLKTGANLTHIPYLAQGAALTDVVSGRVPLLIVPYINVAQYVTSGELKALAVTTRERVAVLPNTQSFKDIPELANFDIKGWAAIYAPARTPPNVIAAYNKAIGEIAADPDFQSKMKDINVEVDTTSGEAARQFVNNEIQMWKLTIEDAKVPTQ